MKQRNIRWILLGLLMNLMLSGCVVNESYKTGREMENQKRWDDAVIFYKKAVDEDPGNSTYRDSLAAAKREAAKLHYEKAKQLFETITDENLISLESVLTKAATAGDLDDLNPAVAAFHIQIRDKIASLQNTVKILYSQAELDMQKEAWGDVVAKLKKVNRIFPNYEDTTARLARAEQESAKQLYQQGISLSKQDEWKLAAQAFKSVIELVPNYYDVAKLHQEAISRDSFDYFSSEAEKAIHRQNWARAVFLFEKALEYQPENADVQKKRDSLKTRVGQIYFDDAVKLLNQGKLYPAMKKAEGAKNNSPALLDDPLFNELQKNLCGRMMERGDKYLEREMWGNALVWYQKVESVNPSHPELFQKLLDVKDHINKRIKKSIAVFDFGSPANDRDAGKIAANKLIAYLHRNASGDLRIIERENLQSILREMQLGQTGIVDMKSAQNVGKMRGIDTFIMGDVLHYMAKTVDTPSVSQVKVLVDEEDVRNPEFSDWLLMHPNPTMEALKTAPPRTTKKKNYQFISYRQGSAKVTALIEISYKLVDTLTGENIFSNTIAGKKIKEDKYQDAVPAGNIRHDPLDLATEPEVMDELTSEKISEMGQSVLKHYQSLEIEYFRQAQQQQQKRRNYDLAIERYVDTVFDEKLKGISTPITAKSIESIDQLIKDK